MPFCSKCGTEVPIEVSFCSKCGYKLQGEQSPTPIAPQVEVSSQSDETKPTLYNPMATFWLGLVSPLFSVIISYLNYRALNNYNQNIRQKLFSNNLASFAEETESKSGLGKCIFLGVLAFLFGPALAIVVIINSNDVWFSNDAPLIAPLIVMIFMIVLFLGSGNFLLFFIKTFLIDVDFNQIRKEGGYHKKSLLTPVVIMIAVAIAFGIIALMLK